MTAHPDKAEFSRFCEECNQRLRERRHGFMKFLQMNDDQLWQNPEFISFLVATTNELLERQEALLQMARTLARANELKTEGLLARIGRAW